MIRLLLSYDSCHLSHIYCYLSFSLSLYDVLLPTSNIYQIKFFSLSVIVTSNYSNIADQIRRDTSECIHSDHHSLSVVPPTKKCVKQRIMIEKDICAGPSIVVSSLSSKKSTDQTFEKCPSIDFHHFCFALCTDLTLSALIACTFPYVTFFCSVLS